MMMRYYLLIAFIFTLSVESIIAQDFTHSLDGISKVIISLENDIRLVSHDQDVLLIKERENYKNKKPEKAEALQSIGSKGSDNTNFGFELRQENSQLFLTGLLDYKAAELVIHLPKRMNIYVESLVNSDIRLSGFESEIEVKNNTGDIFLSDLTGPIVAENVSGNVNIIFSELSQESPTSIVVVNGEIDIEFSKNSRANITTKIMEGEFYTDFELNPVLETKSNTRSITGKINNGGVDVFLQNLKGNIYLKKGR